MSKGITVVTYDSDAPTCRNLFVNQADTTAIGVKQVDLIAKEIRGSGDIGIVSAAASATNQNAWIAAMKQELKKFPKVHLVATVYGNDDPTTATQVTQGLLQRYPNLKGIIAPTSGGGLGQLLAVPDRRRPPRRLPGDRRLRRGAEADGGHRRQRALAGGDGPLL
jgi:rhamnose transport system substrate-binding protein